jgi:photosystem II stability/assembly factor-like uncharacterized protein
MNTNNFLGRFSTMSLILLALSIPAFCDEIHDAAAAGGLTKVEALLKENPKLGSNNENERLTPLQKETNTGRKVVFIDQIGWAIDYDLGIILRSVDHGKTWHDVTSRDVDCMMPWGLGVISSKSAWVWGSYTTETEWYDIPNNIITTQDGGKTWRNLTHLVDWLYNVDVFSGKHVIITGRIRPDDWPKINDPAPHDYNDPLALPLIRFETKDGGRTFARLQAGE